MRSEDRGVPEFKEPLETSSKETMMSSQEEDRILRLRNITYTRLIRDTGNSCSLTDYERQNYLDLLGAARMKEVEDEASCLAGAEDAKESIGRPKCRYGRDCRTGRDGDGKKCRFLHPEKRFILRKTLVKELDSTVGNERK